MGSAPRNSFEWLNVEASPGGVEADDLVDQLRPSGNSDVRCGRSSGSMTTPCARNIAFSRRAPTACSIDTASKRNEVSGRAWASD
jgi:hypothetical protein